MPYIPDGWIEHLPIGEVIAGTPFLCFKVPLHESLSCGIRDSSTMLSVDRLLDHVETNEYDLKMLIDLTNTSRYYKTERLIDVGVEIVKLAVAGSTLPERKQLNAFYDAVARFKSDYPNWERDRCVIGVHCTHGVNRTGYFVCSYLIEQEKWPYQTALEAFGKYRGHQIQRKVYLDALKKWDEQSQ